MKKINHGAIMLGVIALIYATGCSPAQESQKSPNTTAEITEPSPTTETRISASPEPKPKPPAETRISTSPESKPKPPSLPEPETPVIALSLTQEPNQSNPADSLTAIPLAGEDTAAFVDIRGVGDSAMALTHQQPLNLTQKLPQGVPANFGQRLDAFDSTGKSYRGDLSFINWESTVGNRCNQFWAALGPRSFAFTSHPDNMPELYRRGFNLIGLANNHTRDCPNAEEGVDGSYASARHMERLSQQIDANWLWHGVGTEKTAKVRTMKIKGKDVRVAFASLYLAEGDCTYVTCLKDELTVLRSLRDANADIRILAMHSWTGATQQQLVNIGVNFLRNFNGDIVFGHGPHRWKPVRIVESPTGKRGVMFESLGNFIHPSLIASSQHLIGRVLFDINTLQLRQVQIIPIAVNRVNVGFGGTPNPTGVPANLTWQYVSDPTWQSGVSSQARAAYSNIKQ